MDVGAYFEGWVLPTALRKQRISTWKDADPEPTMVRSHAALQPAWPCGTKLPNKPEWSSEAIPSDGSSAPWEETVGRLSAAFAIWGGGLLRCVES